MNELKQEEYWRKYVAKVYIGKQKSNFFNNTYKIKIVLGKPLDTPNLKLDALERKYFQSSNIALLFHK